MLRARIALTLALAVGLGAGCSSTKSGQRYSRKMAEETLGKLESVGLVIGEFPIDGSSSVVDGDTIRVKGLNNSLRLVCIDTEETFKHDSERDAYAAGWDKYLKAMKGESKRPVKMATPLGEDAKKFAQKFFDGVKSVRLERDHPGEIRDYYGRYLAYVLVERDGKWLNYNLEATRAGMTPYFTKYARSRRFDAEFEKAQEEARARKLGVWDPNRQHYPDYDERLAWWNERGQSVVDFEKEMDHHDNYFALTRWDTLVKLEKRVGQEVVLFGVVGDIRLGDKGPSVLKLARSRGSDFDVVFFDKDLLLASGILKKKGEYATVKGTLQKYKNKLSGREKLQIQVSMAGQLAPTSEELDQRLADRTPPPPINLAPEEQASTAVVKHVGEDGKVKPPPGKEKAGRGEAKPGGEYAPFAKDMEFENVDGLLDEPD